MSEYLIPSAELRARVALEKHGFRHSHSLGQNFLLDEGLLSRLLDAAEVAAGENILEIGPGAGVMTALMARRSGRVLAYELDAKLMPVLSEVLDGLDNVEIVNADFLKARDVGDRVRGAFDGQPYRVVANLPYYITADILLKLASLPQPPESICIMVQREAADRIMSGPGSKQWCALAATLRYYGEARVLEEVPPECFDPPPHVTSCFIRIDRWREPPVRPKDEKLFLRLINAAFAMRRKTLANNLKAAFGLDQAAALAVLESAGLDPLVRGESLELDQLCRVADALSGML